MKKYIYVFFCGLPVCGTKRKKKSVCREVGWATAHFPALGQDTTYCIVTGKGTSMQRRTTGDHNTASSPATRPHDTASKGPRHGRPAHGASSSVRAHGLATTVCRDTKFCIVIGGGDTALRHGSSLSDMAHSARCMGSGSRYNFCIVIGATFGVAIRRSKAARGLGAVRASWVPWVCTLCTPPSFETVHCLQSLFGALFTEF